ncbi:hypothetical protein Hanom_Chr06g00511281 [Helianthus anomalus]
MSSLNEHLFGDNAARRHQSQSGSRKGNLLKWFGNNRGDFNVQVRCINT